MDLNEDGLFEYLTVDIEIEVIKAGNYSLMANLCDISGREIVWSADSENLSSGNHIMHLDFDGKSIERHNVNGPYHLVDLVLIRGESEQEYFAQQVMEEEACITRAYTAHSLEIRAKAGRRECNNALRNDNGSRRRPALSWHRYFGFCFKNKPMFDFAASRLRVKPDPC